MSDFVDEPIDLSKLLTGIFLNTDVSETENSIKVLKTWNKILYSIDRYGCNGVKMAEHSRIIDLKHGVLLVEVDHPGWIQLLQMNKKYILSMLRKEVKVLTVNTMAFRLKGSKCELAKVALQEPSDEQIRKDLEKKFAAEEKSLERFNAKDDEAFESEVKADLPPELQKKLDELKNSLLTNSKK